MPKLDEIKARIDWLKELFKIIVTIMVADIAGMAKLYLDNAINGLFYMGGVAFAVIGDGVYTYRIRNLNIISMNWSVYNGYTVYDCRICYACCCFTLSCFESTLIVQP
jgi:hypothetical protein